MNEIDNVFNESCSPNSISNKKTNFMEIKLILDLENWHRKLKNAVF